MGAAALPLWAVPSAPDGPPRILLTGSRTWRVTARIRAGLRWGSAQWPDAILVHGDHWEGADLIGSTLWRSWGLVDEPHPADWALGRKAGPLRNLHMVGLGAVVCLAFIRDDSPGASGCADAAEAAGIRTIRDRRHYR